MRKKEVHKDWNDLIIILGKRKHQSCHNTSLKSWAKQINLKYSMLKKTSRRNTKVKSTIKKVGKETVNFCKKTAKKSFIHV